MALSKLSKHEFLAGADYSRGVTDSDADYPDVLSRDFTAGLKHARDGEDDRMSGGVSLAQGTAAYQEYVEERQGMDRWEREKAEDAREGFGTKGDLVADPFDEAHEARYAELSKQDERLLEQEETQRANGVRVERQVESYRIIKGKQAERIMSHAREMVAATASVADDEFVNDDLGPIMDEMVRNKASRSLNDEEEKVCEILDDFAR